MASGDGGGVTVALEWLDEIEARANAATPGPWVYEPECYGVMVEGADVTICSNALPVDGEFIAAAREDVPMLCRAVRELVGALELSIRVMDAGSLMGVEERLSLKWAASRTLERWGRGDA